MTQRDDCVHTNEIDKTFGGMKWGVHPSEYHTPGMANHPFRLRGPVAYRPLLSMLLLAVILRSAVPAFAGPRWLIVPGAGVGRITFGMADTGVLAAMGAPPAVCLLNASGEDKDTVSLFYYPSRGLALTLSPSTYGTQSVVAAIHIVAGYSAILTNETAVGINGKGYRRCSPNGLLTLNVPRSLYSTNDGIQAGSAETDVVARFGRPQVLYQAVSSHPEAWVDEGESIRAHLMLLMPYPARIYSYGGIIIGIVNSTVVAITMSQMPRPPAVVAWSPRLLQKELMGR